LIILLSLHLSKIVSPSVEFFTFFIIHGHIEDAFLDRLVQAIDKRDVASDEYLFEESESK